MAKRELLAQLDVLDAELKALQGEHYEALHQRVAKIREELDEEPEGISDNIEHFASEFEAEHPTIAGLIRDISTRLAALGI